MLIINKSMFFEIKEEIKKLKAVCRKDTILDIIITDYSVKNDSVQLKIVILFKNEFNKDNKISSEIKKILSKKQIKSDISNFCVDSLLYNPFLIKIIQSGFSIKNNILLYKSLNANILFLISYDLKSLDHSKKTLFGYALKGRKGQKGFLGNLKGQTVGRNSITIPSDKLDEIREFFETWKVSYSVQKFMRINEEK